jgi:predicted permease
MSLLQDVRFAIRMLAKDRGFTLVAVMTLALGIAANNTVFTLVNAVFFRGMPFDKPEQIMGLGTRDGRGRDRGVSYLDFKDWRDSSRAFAGLAVLAGGTMNVSDEGRPPERYFGGYVSANTFGLIGEKPAIGRAFLPEDDRPGAESVVLLGDSVWRNRYGADSGVVGRTIRVNDVSSVVVGIMAVDFKFPFNADMWQPLEQFAGLAKQKRDARNFQVLGRLANGVTIDQARAELGGIVGRLAHDYPDTNKDILQRIQPYQETVNGGQIRVMFSALMGAVVFLLLIACANVANLLLARATRRSREISVRVSLGATRWRIVRQLLVESVLLAAVAGVVGLGLSTIGVRLFNAAVSDPRLGKPYWIHFTMDGQVFTFLAAICLGTGVLFGLAPALHVSKASVSEVLKEGGGRSGTGGRHARRWTSALLVTELALTLVLLAGAGFMMRSFVAMYRMGVGIDTSHITAMQLNLPDRKYPTPEQRTAFFERVEERLGAIRTLPGASITSSFPLGGGQPRLLAIEGRPPAAGETPPTVTAVLAGRRYFDTLGLAVRGRSFLDGDGTPGHEAAVVNQRFVAMHFPNQDPIGQRIQLTDDNAPNKPSWSATIVGISPTVRQRNPQDPDPDPVVYLPYRADPVPFTTLLVRTAGDPAAATSLLREELRAIDPDLPLFNIQTLDERLAVQRWPYSVFGSMFAIFALVALVLSAVGLYAVTAYSVTQRTQEIGIRMALGAQAAQVRWLILRQGLIKLAIGVPIGVAGAFGVGILLKTLLVQTGTRDPITLVSIVCVLTLVSLAACFWPARRATRLDPMVALRYE